MIEGQCQTVQWVISLWCPQSDPRSWYNMENSEFFCDLTKRSRKCQGQNNRSCAQLHHLRELLKPWSKVKVKRLNELWCPPWWTHGRMDAWTHGGHYQVPTGVCRGTTTYIYYHSDKQDSMLTNPVHTIRITLGTRWELNVFLRHGAFCVHLIRVHIQWITLLHFTKFRAGSMAFHNVVICYNNFQ